VSDSFGAVACAALQAETGSDEMKISLSICGSIEVRTGLTSGTCTDALERERLISCLCTVQLCVAESALTFIIRRGEVSCAEQIHGQADETDTSPTPFCAFNGVEGVCSAIGCTAELCFERGAVREARRHSSGCSLSLVFM
jgi:hypothetical protein